MRPEDQIPDTSLLRPDMCCLCSSPSVEIGVFGYPWCEQCRFRNVFLTWGSTHGYPAISTDGGIALACGEGLFNWLVTALAGRQEYVYALQATFDQYERDHGLTE